MPNIWLGGTWMFPFNCGSLYKHVSLLDLCSADLLSSGYICICKDVCFNGSEMINVSYKFLDENVAYELVYTHPLLGITMT